MMSDDSKGVLEKRKIGCGWLVVGGWQLARQGWIRHCERSKAIG
jgi:hypothetical protein